MSDIDNRPAHPGSQDAEVPQRSIARGPLAMLPYLLDLIVPVVSYYALTGVGLSSFWALVAGGSLTAITSVVNTIRRGRLDSFGVLVIVEIILGVVLDLTVQDARLTLARTSFFIAVGGVWVLASAFTRRPVTVDITKPFAAKKAGADGVAAIEWLATNSPRFIRLHRILSATWALSFLAYAVLRVIVIYNVTVSEAIWLNEIPGVIAILIGLITSARMGKKFEAMVNDRRNDTA
jgi:hypothetical protein